LSPRNGQAFVDLNPGCGTARRRGWRKLFLVVAENDERGIDDAARVTELLREWRLGDDRAYDRLVPFVYAELRRLARGQLRREPDGHSLQPTALVHEAYLRLVNADVDWQDRTHFLSVAARVMRRILVEHARGKQALKRGGDGEHVTLTGPIAAPDTDPIAVLALDAAMERLQVVDARQARIVELCYFGGLTCLEAGQALGISEATVHRDLRHARAWLRRELSATSEQRPAPKNGLDRA
jgi:RNA polymerase sigma-70 factor, ECF subfamily